MQTGQMEETLLPKTLALPIFASDPLSSVAYATEEILRVLVVGDGCGGRFSVLECVNVAAFVHREADLHREAPRGDSPSVGSGRGGLARR